MTIEDLYELAVNNLTNEHVMLDLGIVDNELATKIFAETGVDLTGFVISIDNYGIRHAIERHGNSKTEIPRGQVPLQKSDFYTAIEIVMEADNFRYDFRGKIDHSNLKESLVFDKIIADCHYFVSLEVRTVVKREKLSRLVFQTMYIKKIAAP
ncbi:MAG: hypothetical protein H7246_11185 [Phycisphaerae bacterium]|nr:hypothetical protein [Saprospiraceae bacterium]